MSITNNINKILDSDFENFSYLPQKLEIIDLDQGITKFIRDLNITVKDETGNSRAVPLVFNSQELFAERRMNWKGMRSEYGEELTRPFMVLTRKGVKQGTSPLKRTIPVKKKFTWIRVPTFDGTLKGNVLYKIPQPTYIDIEYDLILVTAYVDDANRYYTSMIRDAYSDGQGYMNINGYHISSKIDDPSEVREDDMASEKVYQITFPITVRGKLVDPTKFEKVNTINKIQIKITEKKS